MEDNGRMNVRLSDVVLDCVMPYIHDPKDRDAVSQVLLKFFIELINITYIPSQQVKGLRESDAELKKNN